jgi:hypothetical protein
MFKDESSAMLACQWVPRSRPSSNEAALDQTVACGRRVAPKLKIHSQARLPVQGALLVNPAQLKAS